MNPISANTYTPTEEAEIQQWLTTATRVEEQSKTPAPDSAQLSPILETLNTHLSTRTTLLGSKPSRADTALYTAVRPLVAAWSADERTGEKGYPHIVRHLDFVQNSGAFELSVTDTDKVAVDLDDVRYVKPPVDAKAEKERIKKEKAAAAAAAAGGAGGAGTGAAAGTAPAAAPAGDAKKDATLVDRTKEKAAEVKDKVKAAVGAGDAKPKKEKKEKAPKAPKAPAAAAPLSPSLIDLRVGHILKAIKHPEADSLFVSTIAMGDPAGEDTTEFEGQICRTVCSGLNGLIPLEEMQGRKVVVVCNLKPVKMRGIKSSAMVLAASPRLKEGEVDDHKGPVELVAPPADAKAGDRVFFEGWKGEPEGVLNPKKKVWETIQPGFTTTAGLEVAFDAAAVKELGKEGSGKLVTEAGGVCTVQTLTGATVR
ncbi:GU4 nucleic-binding protein [Verticillium alfalfae VaMs.102]|uniref:GU4 nucleic-binding protein n=1 Tax=Verticillium alfalfae (strain VaMs.102 / ATCC MYA-4576 / FGSC 10136) TaxID=526221 RepID=C9S6T3_VERA1|nr:GU4 nucleic-binding protein [Verticillium alfalfae VaMs.102]EEY15186.1 GU4 nucleic-binding protein [Verticillium alfalfae VaMs.102]